MSVRLPSIPELRRTPVCSFHWRYEARDEHDARVGQESNTITRHGPLRSPIGPRARAMLPSGRGSSICTLSDSTTSKIVCRGKVCHGLAGRGQGFLRCHNSEYSHQSGPVLGWLFPRIFVRFVDDQKHELDAEEFLEQVKFVRFSGNTKVHPGTAAAPNGRSSIPSNTSVHAVSTSSKSSSLDVYIGTNIAKTIETFVWLRLHI